jgi:hypothetical protein
MDCDFGPRPDSRYKLYMFSDRISSNTVQISVALDSAAIAGHVPVLSLRLIL